MKLATFALDNDGTIAVDGVFDPGVRDAIADARRQGIMALLVTGRRLADLRRVAGDLTCFDVIVAENGAVLDFPMSGRHVHWGTRHIRRSWTSCGTEAPLVTHLRSPEFRHRRRAPSPGRRCAPDSSAVLRKIPDLPRNIAACRLEG